MQSRKRRFTVTLVGAAFAAAALPVTAQSKAADPATGFPSRPLRMIVPFAPNGPNDQLARMEIGRAHV